MRVGDAPAVAGEELARTETDAIDAVGIARFAQQKRPAPTAVTDGIDDVYRVPMAELGL